MKKLLALLLLFGIVGCAVTSAMSGVQVSHQFSEAWDGVLVENYDDLIENPSTRKAEAMSISDGRTYHRSQSVGAAQYNKDWFTEQDAVNWHTKSRCEQLYKVSCVISREGRRVIYANLEEYKNKEIETKNYIAKAKIKADKDLRELRQQNKEKEEQKKLAVVNALKYRCISYGFTGYNNIAACVQREAQHDYELEQMQLAQQQLMTRQNQTQTVPKTPWYLFVLEGLAEGIEDGYKQKALIQSMDKRYEKKNNDIYRYCRPNC